MNAGVSFSRNSTVARLHKHFDVVKFASSLRSVVQVVAVLFFYNFSVTLNVKMNRA